MGGVFSNILITILASFYLFPFSFTFLPSVNVKMVMGVMGLIIVIKDVINSQKIEVNKKLLQVFCLAGLLSFYSYMIISYHGTTDTAYVTYIISMSVWLSAAYFLVSVIKNLKGYISVDLLCDYFVWASVAQCIIAIIIRVFTPLKALVNTYIGAAEFIDTYYRLYGIGCALDSAGTRFSCVLIMIAVITDRIIKSENNNSNLLKYIISFIIITVIGSIIARTTLIGISLAILYTLIRNFGALKFISYKAMKFLSLLFVTLTLCIGFIVFIYNTNNDARQLIRFGFEGFFSLAETGKWQVNSNNELQDMYKFPDNSKTWIIGDGMNSAYDRFGNASIFNYADSDVGYVKFIFYFGIIGLAIFCWYLIYSTKVCSDLFPKYTMMFIFFLLANFIIWFKVSTDLFFVFAPFLTFSEDDPDYLSEYEYDELNN